MTTRDEVVGGLTAPGAAFEIHVEDVLGEPLEVFRHRHRSLGELLERSAEFGDAEYLVTTQRRLSFVEHREEVAALARALQQEHGVVKGDRVAICAANCPEWIVAFWATVSLGAVAVGMNSLWAAPEIEHGLRLTEPKALVADGPRRELAGDLAIPVLSTETEVGS